MEAAAVGGAVVAGVGAIGGAARTEGRASALARAIRCVAAALGPGATDAP